VSYRRHDPPTPLLFGYDPVRDLAPDHLARLVEAVVDEAVSAAPIPNQRGQPAYDPRLLAKVLTYGYSTGVRSSRQLERMCKESLPYLFLTRGEAPSYRTLCSFRVEHIDMLEQVWLSLFTWAGNAGMNRLGRIAIDSSKFRADASSDSVVKAENFTKIREVLERILEEVKAADAHDEQEPPGQTQIGLNVNSIDPMQMRDIIRSAKKSLETAKETSETPKPPLGPRMVPRIQAAIDAIKEAEAEGRKHACLTDPDARMMSGGRDKTIRERHSFEVAVDSKDGLLAAAQVTNIGTDNSRLLPLVEAAKEQEPNGIISVDADSGYYSGDGVASLIEKGIDTCIPDSNTACDLHRGHPIGTTQDKARGRVPFTYDEKADCYLCPQGNRLQRDTPMKHHGQTVKVYRAVLDCTDCPLKSVCMTQPKAKYRTLKVGVKHKELEAARQRFAEEAHVERYSHRSDVVESVFGFLRSVLGFHRWSLRGSARVSCEASLFKLAYQMRKVHIRWRQSISPAGEYANGIR
jgi:transposase